VSTETQEKSSEAKSITITQAPAPLALKGDTFDDLHRQAKALSPSALIPKHLRGKDDKETLANVTLVLAYGRELGLGPIASLSGVAVVNGRPFAESQTLAAAVRASGECLYLRRTEASAQSVTWETHRRGEPTPDRRTFTMNMAQTAGLAGRDTYKQHAERMLSARALGWLLRDVYPDVTKGMGTEVEREDALYRAEAEPPPPVGVAGLKATLLKRHDVQQAATPEPAREPLPMSHPDAEPPDEPGANG
jgi:hypothetical protein